MKQLILVAMLLMLAAVARGEDQAPNCTNCQKHFEELAEKIDALERYLNIQYLPATSWTEKREARYEKPEPRWNIDNWTKTSIEMSPVQEPNQELADMYTICGNIETKDKP